MIGRRITTHARLGAMSVAAVVILAACGGSDGATASPSTSSDTTVATTAAGPTTTLPESFVVLCDNGFSVEVPADAMSEAEAERLWCTPPTTAPWAPQPDLLVDTARSTWPAVFGAVSGDAIVVAGEELCSIAETSRDATAFGDEATAIFDAGFAQLGDDVFGLQDWSMFSVASLSTMCRPEMFRLYG